MNKPMPIYDGAVTDFLYGRAVWPSRVRVRIREDNPIFTARRIWVPDPDKLPQELCYVMPWVSCWIEWPGNNGVLCWKDEGRMKFRYHAEKRNDIPRRVFQHDTLGLPSEMVENIIPFKDGFPKKFLRYYVYGCNEG